MAEKNIYDEIVQCLREIRKQTAAVPVSPEVMQEFLTDYPRKRSCRNPLPEEEQITSSRQYDAIAPRGNTFSENSLPEERNTFSDPAAPFGSAPMPGQELPASGPVCTGPSPEEVSTMDFEQMLGCVRTCSKCKLCSTRTHTVFEDGSRQAELLFLGEGPGADEDAQGVPFVGKAGQLLTKMIQAMQFERQEVYICNVVKCRPPANRNPENDEVTACLPYMKRQIELVNPKAIVILGAVPLRALFPKIYGGIKSLRGKWMQYNNIPVMPTYHPAYLLRDPSAKRDAWADLQLVMAHLGKTLPLKTKR